MERWQATYDPCLASGGAMGAQMRALDWSQTTMEPVQTGPQRWPQSLQTAVSICLNSRFLILLWWGPERLMLYNDAHRPILGATKHPHALGRPGQTSWPEIWPIISPMLEGVLTRGEATWSDVKKSSGASQRRHSYRISAGARSHLLFYLAQDEYN